MKEKDKQVTALVEKLKKIATSSLKYEKWDRTLAAVSFAAEIQYTYNQKYADDELEALTGKIGETIKAKQKCAKYSQNEITKNILVYDGFGFDTRGVILMYLNALGLDGYQVCYVTDKNAENEIPTIKSMCDKYGFQIMYIDMSGYHKWVLQLINIFEEKKPRAAFFYTTPYDSSACAAFHIYEGLCKRYLIDLTDHAFWLGKCANDYFLGSREMSAYIQHYQRKIPKEKCIKLGVNLLIQESSDHTGIPFDLENNKYVFSGGSLYKTLGDSANTYYRIVRRILEHHQDIKYIYAGTGDDNELKKILRDFPDRAFHISERKDFYYIIKNSVFYLNTYPMFGGMMMKYSALAHKLPITLKHGSDSDGLLLHQKECKIEYDSYEELIKDVDHLLQDENYRKEREKLLTGSVITEERFARNIQSVIEKNSTDYSHEFIILDTQKFRKEYYDRFNFEQNILRMANKRNIELLPYFPRCFVIKAFKKLMNKER